LVPPNTVIVSSRAPIGHLVINQVPMATNQGCKSLITRDGLDFNFLYYYLKANVELLDSLGTGTTFKELSGAQLKTVNIPVPPFEEQKRIVALLDDATARVAELTACYEHARTHANNLFTSALREALEVNPGWPIKTIGDLMTVQNGYAFDSQYFSPSGKIGLIRIRDLKSGVGTETNFVGPYDDEYVVTSGDYLIGMDGEFRCYEWKGAPALLNQRVCRLRDFGEMLDARFLFFGINKFLKEIEDITGYTTVKHLSSKSILAIEMPVPPLDEQKRIVGRLDSIKAMTSEMVATYNAKLAAAKNLRQSILEAAFAGEL
jgi:type I restriction enzyme S subunit